MSAFSYYYSWLGEVPHHQKKKKKKHFHTIINNLEFYCQKKKS